MTAPVAIPGYVIDRAVQIGTSLAEAACIAIATWLIHVGRRELRQTMRALAVAAAGEAIAPMAEQLDQLVVDFGKHEDLDEDRHRDVMAAIASRQRA